MYLHHIDSFFFSKALGREYCLLKRLLISVRSFLTLGGGAPPLKLPVDNLDASHKTQVLDLRPPTEGRRELFGTRSTSDRFGYIRAEQNATDPSGPRLFAHHLQMRYGNEALPSTTLHHFVVYLNIREEKMALVNWNSSIADTPLFEGSVVHTIVDREFFAMCSGEDEYKRALFDEPAIPAGTSAFIIYIERETLEKRYFTRTVYPLRCPSKRGETPGHLALDAAISFNLDQ